MKTKGKIAVGCMFLVLVVLWSYAPLAAADDEEDIVDMKSTRYNIRITIYDYNDHALQLTSVTIPEAGCTSVWYHVVNNSPSDFWVTYAKFVSVYSNEQKSVYKCWYSILSCWYPNDLSHVKIPAGYDYEYHWSICATASNAVTGGGTLKMTVYGYEYSSPSQPILVKSYTLRIPLTVTP